MKIVEITSRADRREFLSFPKGLYRNDPFWITPLDNEVEAVFDPSKNPTFKPGEATRWLLQDERGDIYCVWGEFRVHRELIYDGIRFTLPNCKNGVQWTVTPNPANMAQVMIHCTINRPTQDADFVESLEIFVNDWRAGLEDWPIRRAAKLNKPCVNCGDTFGGFG